MQIISNNKPRHTLDWCDLTDKERADFDYRDENDGAVFARYKGATYDLSDFPRADKSMSPWDGALTDTYFSAILCRFPDNDTETVIMGRCYS